MTLTRPLRIAMITDTYRSLNNPGDVAIYHGIRAFFDKAFGIGGWQQIPLHAWWREEQQQAAWDYLRQEGDLLVLAGRPRVSTPMAMDLQGGGIWETARAARDAGIPVWDLWPGSSYPSPTITDAKQLAALRADPDVTAVVEAERDVASLVLCRDRVMLDLVSPCEHAYYAPDSVFYVPEYLGVEPGERAYDVIVPYGLPSHPQIGRRLIEMHSRWDGPVRLVCHGSREYAWLRELGAAQGDVELVCDVRGLTAIYSQARRVVSMRMHGAVLAVALGCEVVNYHLDKRCNMLRSLGIPSHPFTDALKHELPEPYVMGELLRTTLSTHKRRLVGILRSAAARDCPTAWGAAS
jgi:hypothetical protein